MTNAVDEYLARLSKEHRDSLQKLRETVLSVVPDADEVIRQGVPRFDVKGRPLVSIGAAKRHVALYVMYGSVLEDHSAVLSAYDWSRTVVRFKPDRPLPLGLVAKLVRARLADIEPRDRNAGD